MLYGEDILAFPLLLLLLLLPPVCKLELDTEDVNVLAGTVHKSNDKKD
jgi:hypothetical protein